MEGKKVGQDLFKTWAWTWSRGNCNPDAGREQSKASPSKAHWRPPTGKGPVPENHVTRSQPFLFPFESLPSHIRVWAHRSHPSPNARCDSTHSNRVLCDNEAQSPDKSAGR